MRKKGSEAGCHEQCKVNVTLVTASGCSLFCCAKISCHERTYKHLHFDKLSQLLLSGNRKLVHFSKPVRVHKKVMYTIGES